MVTDWKTELKSLLVDSPGLRWGWLALVGLLLLASGAGLYASFHTPTRAQEVTVLEHRQQGTFDYQVHLKPNDFFDESTLDARQVLLMELTDRLDVTFAYEFQASESVEDQAYEHQIIARFGDPELWEMERVVTGPVITSEPSFSATFPISVPQYITAAQTFQERVGARMDPARLTILARVRPRVNTAYGPINDPFEQDLTFFFQGSTIRRESDLTQTAADEIVRMESVPILTSTQVRWLRIGSGAGLGISLSLLAGIIWLWAQAERGIAAPERELQRARRQAGGLLVETEELPHLAEGHVEAKVHSLDDLLELAEETLRPIICSQNGQGYVYCAIDGASGVRYTYTSAPGQEEDEVREDERQPQAAGPDNETRR